MYPFTVNTSAYGNTSTCVMATNDDQTIHSASISYYVVASAMCCFGTTANALFLLSFVKARQLWTVSNVLLWHLAFTDLLNCCVSIPWYMAVTSNHVSIRTCYLWKVLFTLLPSMSMQSQCLISVNRYCLVTKSVSVYKKWFSRQMTAAYLTLGWTVHIIIVACVSVVTKKTHIENPKHCNSFTEFSAPRKLNYYILGCGAVVYVAVASAFYRRLILFVRRNAMTMNAASRADSKTSLTLFILLIFSVVTLIFSPIALHINAVFRATPLRLNTLDEIGTCVLFFNYSINPVVYAFRLRSFTNSLKSLFCSSCTNRIGQDPRLRNITNNTRVHVQATAQSAV